MASMAFVFILVATAIVRSISAKEFIVGDNKGWTTKFNYEAWALGKDFRVGDQLVFKYTKGEHNVFNVDGTTFQQCVPPLQNEALTSGNDVITLESPGQKWFICGVGNHCEAGQQKLHITVFPQSIAPEAQPRPETGSPQSSASRIYRFECQVFTFIVITTVNVILLV